MKVRFFRPHHNMKPALKRYTGQVGQVICFAFKEQRYIVEFDDGKRFWLCPTRLEAIPESDTLACPDPSDLTARLIRQATDRGLWELGGGALKRWCIAKADGTVIRTFSRELNAVQQFKEMVGHLQLVEVKPCPCCQSNRVTAAVEGASSYHVVCCSCGVRTAPVDIADKRVSRWVDDHGIQVDASNFDAVITQACTAIALKAWNHRAAPQTGTGSCQTTNALVV